MAIIERYQSPDGLLKLLVDFTADDWSIGFAGVAGHTHGDILAAVEGGSPESATKAYVKDILASKRMIVIRRINGNIHDAWIADGPNDDLMKYAGPNETIKRAFGTAHRWQDNQPLLWTGPRRVSNLF
jgi:hypothetical protein